MHAHIYIQCTRGGSDEILMYPPTKPKLGKMWIGLNRNQGAVREHHEQYQLSTRT